MANEFQIIEKSHNKMYSEEIKNTVLKYTHVLKDNRK